MGGIAEEWAQQIGPRMPIAISGNPSFFLRRWAGAGDRFGPTSTSRCHWRWRQAFLGEFRDEAVKMQSRSGSPSQRLRETQTGENEAKVDKNGRRKVLDEADSIIARLPGVFFRWLTLLMLTMVITGRGRVRNQALPYSYHLVD